ncbi:MAG: helicase HerA-like domain-containing protein [Acidimicrobiales bacterium]
MGGAELWAGERSEAATHERQVGERVVIEADDLTTHGVIVGMTGSGKTGLGVVLIEEALRAGVPVLALDLKGDLTNLLLQFPELAAGDFAPWVPAGSDPAAVAEAWGKGLADWGIDGPAIGSLASGHRSVVLTPGSTAGVPVDLFGSLQAPASDDPEVRTDEAESIVSGLLGLVGVASDPLAGREHILLVNLLQKAWADGTDLDLGGLVTQVENPPMRKLGVIEVAKFFPKKDRTELAMKLNGLLASPAFAAWNQGAPFDVEATLWAPDGRPTCAVVYLAHLSDDERQAVVALLLSKVVTWMRSQSGSTALRALVYMDEVSGYVPPSEVPPAKKPILTILKQARAYGVGMILATQNPVDLDYKAVSNAGTWLMGRLTTERDKARLLEGMASASGAVDIGQVDATISGLAKREFLLHRAGGGPPITFLTRWAMSYLAGPLTRDQLNQLPGVAEERALLLSSSSAPPPARAGELPEDEVATPPAVAGGVAVRWLDPAAPWAGTLAAVAGSPRHRAAAAVRVALRFDEADLVHDEVFEAVYPLVAEQVDPARAVIVDFDDRDLLAEPPPGATYVASPAPIESKAFFTRLERALEDHLYRTRTLAGLANPALRLVSRPGEDQAAFAARCDAAADEGADRDTDALRARYEARLDRAEVQLARAADRVAEVEESSKARRNEELFGGAGALLGAVLGGRGRTRTLVRGLGGVAGRRGRSRTASQRRETVGNRAAEAADAVADLEADLQDDLVAIAAEWDNRAAQVEPLPVSLEKADVSLQQVTVVWVPVGRAADAG